MSDDYLFDKQGQPDPDAARLEQLLAPLRHQRPLPALPPRAPAPRPAPRPRWPWALAAAALLLLSIGLAALWPQPQPDAAAWPVAVTQGAPTLDGAPLRADSRLAIGQRLQTDHRSSARLAVADIGHIDLAPNSLLQLDATGAQHRLSLTRGQLHARVIAPPRLLIVHTPLADAVDLGCEYTLSVLDDGATALRVQSGFVALETPDHTVLVPQGAAANAHPALGLTTPAFEDADPDFLFALRTFDVDEHDRAALQRLLALARARDTLSLWHLLYRAAPPERGLLYDRIRALAPDRAPAGLTRQHALDLDKQILQEWLDQLWLSW